VRMPRTNQFEHVQGIYKTGLGENLMRNFAWRDLPNVDKTVNHFASRLNFFYEDLEWMMARSRGINFFPLFIIVFFYEDLEVMMVRSRGLNFWKKSSWWSFLIVKFW